MRKTEKSGCRPILLLLCALLLVGCRSSYVEVSDGKGWDTLGYHMGVLPDESVHPSNGVPGESSVTYSVILPDGSTTPAPSISSETTIPSTIAVEPDVSTESPGTTLPTVATDAETTTLTGTTTPTPTPTLPEDPVESLTILEFTQTVAKGSKATVSIRGLPNTEYTIKVKYSSGYSSAAGLEPQVSDADGVCSWTWRVGGSTRPGSYPITISDGDNSYTLTFTVE